MIKKISSEQLRVGMHLHGMGGSWFNHPFWNAKTLLQSQQDIDKLMAHGVKELWIDTRLGLDTDGKQHPDVIEGKVAFSPEAAANGSSERGKIAPEMMMNHAAALCRRAVPLVKKLFADVRQGKPCNLAVCHGVVQEITHAVIQDHTALLSVMRLKTRDEYTYMHSLSVCALMIALGRTLRLDDAQLHEVGLAGLLHDIGKVAVPSDILERPGKLQQEEVVAVRRHSVNGCRILKQVGEVSPVVLDVCLHHHERFDGSGYPHHLKGSEISLFSKMAAVCDVYDAVTSRRSYRDPWDPARALGQMAQRKGEFDGEIFQAFVRTVGVYPIGTLLRLKSGRLGVVTAQNPHALLKPKVKVFFSTKADMHIEPQDIDLAGSWCPDQIVGVESYYDSPFDDLEQLWGAPAYCGGRDRRRAGQFEGWALSQEAA